MNRRLLRVLIMTMCICILISFTVVGCKATVGETTIGESTISETTTETAAAETTAAETSGEKVKIVAWIDVADYIPFYENAASLFMEENPNIEVEIVLIPSLGWEQGLTAAFIAGTEPDVSYIQGDLGLQIAQIYDPWLDLTKYGAAEWPEYKLMFPTAAANLTYNDKLYGLDYADSWTGLFIRKSWMENVGWNKEYPYVNSWDDMVELAKKFTFEDPDQNGKNDTWGYEMFGSLSRNYATMQFEYMMNAAGEELVEDGKLNFNTDIGIATCQAMQDYIYKYEVSPKDSSTYTHVEFYRDVEGGILGMGRGADWNITNWDEKLKGDYVIVPYPPMEEGPYGYQSGLYSAMCISKNSKHPEEAIKFARFNLSSKPVQEVFYKNIGSCVRTDLDFNSLATSERLIAFKTVPKELLNIVFLVQDSNWTTECKEILAIHVQKVMADPNADPATEMKAAEDEISKIFYK